MSRVKVKGAAVFIESEAGEYIQIFNLLSSREGYYTFIDSSISDDIACPIIYCRKCGKPFNPNFYNKGKCPKCGAQN